MIADGYLVGDGSWELRIFVTDLKVERNLRVKGDLHIGGVMLKLVEDLDVAVDWSDHALWWPKKKSWLARTRSTLDQYGVQADALLHFTPMHKTCRVQLPDLRVIDARLDFSVKCFSAVVQFCKHLGIRHPEELSFCRPLSAEHLKKNHQKLGVTSRQRSHDFQPTSNGNVSQMAFGRPSEPESARSAWSVGWPANDSISTSASPASYDLNQPSASERFQDTTDGSALTLPNLAEGGLTGAASQESKQSLLGAKTLSEKARLNVAWLDSSLSLYEQDVQELDLLQLRFKFAAYYDLSRTQDAVRIHQLFEQARYSLLGEQVDCSEPEMYLFAALQLQAGMGRVPQQNGQSAAQFSNVDEQIESAIDELQAQLEGVSVIGGTNRPGHNTGLRVGGRLTNGSHLANITHVPELCDYLRIMRPRRFTLKTYKTCYFVFKDCRLVCYKSRDERGGQPLFTVQLRGAEITPDVNLSQSKYSLKLEVPEYATSSLNSSNGNSQSAQQMNEFWLRFSSEEQYVRWLAAFRLAIKGKTMADALYYDAECRQIGELLSLQHPAVHGRGGSSSTLNASQLDHIALEDFIAPRFLRKIKSRQQIIQRILEAHVNIKDLAPIDAKLKYIRAWQALPEYGVSLFIVKFVGAKKEELLGVAPNRLMRMDLQSGDHLKTWSFSNMKSWNVNWEIKQMQVEFEEENVRFQCLSADCKVVHEFIGGYIFLSMRSKDHNQSLNEELFHKLTGGWM